jgi:hypothetical protein
MALVDNAWYVNYGNGTNTGYCRSPSSTCCRPVEWQCKLRRPRVQEVN